MHTFKTHNEGISRSSTKTFEKKIFFKKFDKYLKKKKKKKKIPGQSLKCGEEIETVKGREIGSVKKRGEFFLSCCCVYNVCVCFVCDVFVKRERRMRRRVPLLTGRDLCS